MLVSHLLEIERLTVGVDKVAQRAEPREIDPPATWREFIRLFPGFEAIVGLHCRSSSTTIRQPSARPAPYTGIGRSEGETASGAPVTAWISSTL